MLVNGTPLEPHRCGGAPVLVKREDLCCPPPGPSFSKMRGVVSHMRARPETTIGVLDTFHSKAGWAVSWAGSHLGKRVINFWPRYKADPKEGLVREQQKRAQGFGATMVSMPAGRSAILYHRARKYLKQHHPGAYLMPNALKLSESIEETAQEVSRTNLPHRGTLVVSISSGTIAAGVLRGVMLAGLEHEQIIFHMGYSRPEGACRAYIQKAAGLPELPSSLRLVDEGYSYKDDVEIDTPFPCNSHYDAKAWKWLTGEIEGLPHPVVFWNIGD